MPSVSADSANYTVDACDGDDKWKTTLFLGAPSPKGFFVGINTWTSDQYMSYGKGHLLKTMIPSLVFTGLAVVSVLLFFAWRFMRCCCVSCCMIQSCRRRRSQWNPKLVLTRRWAVANKVLAVLITAAALAMSIYGMVSDNPKLISQVWPVVNTTLIYTARVTTNMDSLVGNVQAIGPAIDVVVMVANRDVNPTAFSAQLTALGTLLDKPALNPAAIVTGLNALVTDQASLSAGLTGLSASFTDVTNVALPALTTATSTLSASAGGKFGNWASSLNSVNSAMTSMSPTNSPADANNLQAAMNNAVLSGFVADAASIAASLSAVLTRQASYFSGISAQMVAFKALASSTQNNDIPPLSNGLSNLDSLYNANNQNGAGTIAAVITRLQYINVTVFVLNPSFLAAYNQLQYLNLPHSSHSHSTPLPLATGLFRTARSSTLEPTRPTCLPSPSPRAPISLSCGFPQSVSTNLVTLFAATPNPAALVTGLAALSSALNLPASYDNLKAGLDNLQTVMNNISPSDLNTMVTADTRAQSSFTNLASPYSTTQTLLTAYLANTASNAAYNALYASVNTNTGYSQQFVAAAATACTLSAGETTSFSNIAGQMAALSAGLGTFPTSDASNTRNAVASIQATLAASVPANLPTYVTLATSAQAGYNALPSPKSSALTASKNTLAIIANDLVTQPAAAKAQASSAAATISSAEVSVKANFVAKVNNIQDTYTPKTKQYDQYKHAAVLAVYGLGILCALLLLTFVLTNCAFGTGLLIFVMLLVCVLFFLLSIIVGAVLVAGQDGCYAAENITTSIIPDKFQPLAQYYYFSTSGVSVKAVLNSSGLVDLYSLSAQLSSAQAQITTAITSNFSLVQPAVSPVGDLQASETHTLGINVIASLTASILGTFGATVELLDQSQVLPVYIAAKGYVCCTAMNDFSYLWTGLTFTAWLFMILSWCCMVYLHRLDKLPQSGCCGCRSMVRPAQLGPGGRGQGSVHGGRPYPIAAARGPGKGHRNAAATHGAVPHHPSDQPPLCVRSPPVHPQPRTTCTPTPQRPPCPSRTRSPTTTPTCRPPPTAAMKGGSYHPPAPGSGYPQQQQQQPGSAAHALYPPVPQREPVPSRSASYKPYP
ncbi:MAG: hypothetical protein WDW36_003923 [Sanguina aurantia]